MSYDILNVDKVGGLISQLSNNVDNLFFTKLVKLMYIIDETSIKEVGVPVTWLEYNVARKGPLPVGLWEDITQNTANNTFKEYIDVVYRPELSGYKIESKKVFKEMEFSKYEKDLINRVIDEYGNWDTESLVDFLHRDETPWGKIVKENNIDFENPDSNPITPFKINFKEMVDQEDQENYDFIKALKQIR